MAYAGGICPNLRDGGGQQSLLSTMNRFVQSVREMDETIMIPYRLKDIDTNVLARSSNGANCNACGTNGAASGAESSNGNANGSHSTALVPMGSTSGSMDAKANTNLYAFYKMLKTVKTELVRGHEGGEDAEGDDAQEPTDETSKEVASAFRHHLQGLFGMLKQLTDTAQHVKGRYQEEVGDITSSNFSSFTL